MLVYSDMDNGALHWYSMMNETYTIEIDFNALETKIYMHRPVKEQGPINLYNTTPFGEEVLIAEMESADPLSPETANEWLERILKLKAFL